MFRLPCIPILFLAAFGFILSCTPKEDIQAKHVILIGLDAFSARGLQQASTPNLDMMIKNGALVPYARCVIPTVSTPNWTSMLTGADPVQHGIYDNSWERDQRHWSPITTGTEDVYPSIISWIKTQRPSAKIHFFYEWSGMARMFEMSQVDKVFRDEKGETVFRKAMDAFFEEKPDFLFLGIDETDGAGHKFGHDTEGYFKSISFYDELIGELLRKLEAADLLKETMILVTGDHGGIDFGHGGNTLEELEIPIILFGKGIKPGVIVERPSYIYDVAPTLAYSLGITPEPASIGRPIMEAYEGNGSESTYITFPTISPKSGFHKANSLEIQLTTGNPSAKIYYTLDGSEPDTHSNEYAGPFTIDKSTPVKAISISGNNKSRIESATFKLASGEKPVSWAYYEGDFKKVPDSNSLRPKLEGAAHEFHLLEVPHREDHFAVRFSSTFMAKESGTYIFSTNSDDGSMLWVNGDLVVDNDGSHGNQKASGKIELEAGEHTIVVGYFEDYMGESLKVMVQGPGIAEQILSGGFLVKK